MNLNPKLPAWTQDGEYVMAVGNLILQRQIACDELDAKQLSSVIVQALACGDIQKLVVQGSDAQSVIYIPFSESERLKSRIKKLEDLLEQHGIKEDEPEWIDS